MASIEAPLRRLGGRPIERIEARQREPAGHAISLLHAKPDRRRCPTLRAIRRSPTWAKNGHERFAGVAIDRAICMYCADIYGRRIALVSLIAFWPLRPLWPLCTGHSLRTRNALHTLGALRAGRALRSWVTLRSRLSSTAR